MKTALIGGAGFIGSALARSLQAQKQDISIVDVKPSAAFPALSVIADVCDADAMKQTLSGVDRIIHLAAEHRDDVRPVQKYYDVNVGGARNVIGAAEAHGIKTIIFTSSVAVYGLNAGEARETQEPAPFNDYGRSKLESEKLFEDWARASPDRTLVIIRLVATFGAGNRGNIHTLMGQIARGKFIMVGAGRNRKSIAYVGNVAAFLVHALSFPPGLHVYNYADKPDLTTAQLVHIITRHFGRKPPKRLPYSAGLLGGVIFDLAARVTGRHFPISAVRVQKFCADTIVNADAAKATGFVAPFPLQDGLQYMMQDDFPT